MANKNGKTTKNDRRWAKNELELFSEVLDDLENNFAISLKKIAFFRRTSEGFCVTCLFSDTSTASMRPGIQI